MGGAKRGQDDEDGVLGQVVLVLGALLLAWGAGFEPAARPDALTPAYLGVGSLLLAASSLALFHVGLKWRDILMMIVAPILVAIARGLTEGTLSDPPVTHLLMLVSGLALAGAIRTAVREVRAG